MPKLSISEAAYQMSSKEYFEHSPKDVGLGRW